MVALVRSAPPRRQPAGTQVPQVPRLATCNSSTPLIGVAAGGQVALGEVLATTAPAAAPSVLPASPCVKVHTPSRAVSARRRSVSSSACLPVSSVTLRSPRARSSTMSALKFGALRTSMWPPTARSPPQPKSGCQRASSGATVNVSSSAFSSICAGCAAPSAACQWSRLQRSAPPSTSARPGCSVACGGPPAHCRSSTTSCVRIHGAAPAPLPFNSSFDTLPRQPAKGDAAVSPPPPCACSVASVRVAAGVLAAAAVCNESVHAGGKALASACTSRRCSRAVPLRSRRSDSIVCPAELASVSVACASTGSLAELPICHFACAFCTLTAPTRKAVPSSWPCVVTTGQRPSTRALAFSAPENTGLSVPGFSIAHNGASRSSAAAFRRKSHASSAPLPLVLSLPSACSVLPAASRFTVASSGARSALRSSRSPCSGTPASRLFVKFRWA